MFANPIVSMSPIVFPKYSLEKFLYKKEVESGFIKPRAEDEFIFPSIFHSTDLAMWKGTKPSSGERKTKLPSETINPWLAHKEEGRPLEKVVKETETVPPFNSQQLQEGWRSNLLVNWQKPLGTTGASPLSLGSTGATPTAINSHPFQNIANVMSGSRPTSATPAHVLPPQSHQSWLHQESSSANTNKPLTTADLIDSMVTALRASLEEANSSLISTSNPQQLTASPVEVDRKDAAAIKDSLAEWRTSASPTMTPTAANKSTIADLESFLMSGGLAKCSAATGLSSLMSSSSSSSVSSMSSSSSSSSASSCSSARTAAFDRTQIIVPNVAATSSGSIDHAKWLDAAVNSAENESQFCDDVISLASDAPSIVTISEAASIGPEAIEMIEAELGLEQDGPEPWLDIDETGLEPDTSSLNKWLAASTISEKKEKEMGTIGQKMEWLCKN